MATVPLARIPLKRIAVPAKSATARKPSRESSRRPSPFVKWVGGKGRIIPQLSPLLPPGVERMRHVEPFVGGGALFFSRLPERALLCDINADLINTYTEIRDNVDKVIGALTKLAAVHDKERYYAVRSRYNTLKTANKSGPSLRTKTQRAAMFVYLNKTCFNGLHRVNRRGEFNVPMGSYKNPRIVNDEGLRLASQTLQGVEIVNSGFEGLLKYARPGDFVYFDPPYAPVSDTANFTSYTKAGFNHDNQTQLRDVFRALDKRGCKLMLSNSDVTSIRDLYEGYQIDVVAAPRAINCNARRRGKVNEVVVRNYR